MSLYVYCVLPDASPTSPEVTGIQNQLVQIIDIESLGVMSSPFSGSKLLPTKDNLLMHERVVESCMDRVTPLPFRFGAVVHEEKLRDFIRTNLAILKQDLEDVRGCVEMGVKVMLQNDIHRADVAVTGTEFLQAKRQLQQVQRETAGWVEAAVVGLVRRTDVGLMQGTGSLIVRIAHLVLRDHQHEYKSHMDALVRERTEYRFLRSGPWPPYSFVSTPRVD
jgi:hypothetical protein